MQFQKKQLKSQIRASVYPAACLALVALAITGCSGSNTDPAKASAPGTVTKQTLTSAPTQTAVTLVSAQAGDGYNYIPAGRRDPFAPIMERETKKAKSGDRPPLERYSISELKLSGIVWGGFGYSAMVEGPDGKGYFVRTGTVLGPNRGIVKKITQNMMIIEEKFKTYSGETERKEIILELRKKQEEAP